MPSARERRRIVVIGAGMGGLAAAIDLARRGAAVTLLERASTPGGKMRRVSVGDVGIDGGPTVFTMRWVFDGLLRDAGARLEDVLRTGACGHPRPPCLARRRSTRSARRYRAIRRRDCRIRGYATRPKGTVASARAAGRSTRRSSGLSSTGTDLHRSNSRDASGSGASTSCWGCGRGKGCGRPSVDFSVTRACSSCSVATRRTAVRRPSARRRR